MVLKLTLPSQVLSYIKDSVYRSHVHDKIGCLAFAGVSHYASNNEMDAIAKMREVFDFLPLSNLQQPPVRQSADSRDRSDIVLSNIIPPDANTPYVGSIGFIGILYNYYSDMFVICILCNQVRYA